MTNSKVFDAGYPGEPEMEKQHAGNIALNGAATVGGKYEALAGRAGVVVAIAVFIVGYLYGLLEYGPVLGIALGWLPCGIAAWVTAIAVASTINLMSRLGLFRRLVT